MYVYVLCYFWDKSFALALGLPAVWLIFRGYRGEGRGGEGRGGEGRGGEGRGGEGRGGEGRGGEGRGGEGRGGEGRGGEGRGGEGRGGEGRGGEGRGGEGRGGRESDKSYSGYDVDMLSKSSRESRRCCIIKISIVLGNVAVDYVRRWELKCRGRSLGPQAAQNIRSDDNITDTVFHAYY